MQARVRPYLWDGFFSLISRIGATRNGDEGKIERIDYHTRPLRYIVACFDVFFCLYLSRSSLSIFFVFFVSWDVSLGDEREARRMLLATFIEEALLARPVPGGSLELRGLARYIISIYIEIYNIRSSVGIEGGIGLRRVTIPIIFTPLGAFPRLYFFFLKFSFVSISRVERFTRPRTNHIGDTTNGVRKKKSVER